MFIQAIASSNFVVSLRLYLSHLLLGGYFISVYPEIVAGFLASFFSLSEALNVIVPCLIFSSESRHRVHIGIHVLGTVLDGKLVFKRKTRLI